MKILKTPLNVKFATMPMLMVIITTGKYRSSAHRDYNINIEVNHKISIGFHNLKNYDSQESHLQELDKFNFKISYKMN